MEKMYYCEVWGDMAADSAADQYPTVAVCESCIKEQGARAEGNEIVSVGIKLVTDKSETCHFCGCGFDGE
jgi:hypothetical protein